MSAKHNNNGGNNTFYDIPQWVKNVDDLSEYLNATSAMGNVLKSLFGMNKSRHAGTSADRDAKKILHYGVRILLWLKRPQNENIEDVDLLIELYKELPKHKQEKFATVINVKEPHPESTIMKSIDAAISKDVDGPANGMEILADKVYTHIETSIHYIVHALMSDGDMIVVLQEGYARGTTESFSKEEFLNQFKLKG